MELLKKFWDFMRFRIELTMHMTEEQEKAETQRIRK